MYDQIALITNKSGGHSARDNKTNDIELVSNDIYRMAVSFCNFWTVVSSALRISTYDR